MCKNKYIYIIIYIYRQTIIYSCFFNTRHLGPLLKVFRTFSELHEQNITKIIFRAGCLGIRDNWKDLPRLPSIYIYIPIPIT